MRLRRASGFAVTLGLLTATVALAPSTAGAGGTPLWVKHVRNYPGGISGAVRARLIAIESGTVPTATSSTLQPVPGTDVQMNEDCDPALPQNETSRRRKRIQSLERGRGGQATIAATGSGSATRPTAEPPGRASSRTRSSRPTACRWTSGGASEPTPRSERDGGDGGL